MVLLVGVLASCWVKRQLVSGESKLPRGTRMDGFAQYLNLVTGFESNLAGMHKLFSLSERRRGA